VVNQTQQAGTWVSLGSFSFTEGDGGAGRQVTLSDNAGGCGAAVVAGDRPMNEPVTA
jgi:hypothetical protein